MVELKPRTFCCDVCFIHNYFHHRRQGQGEEKLVLNAGTPEGHFTDHFTDLETAEKQTSINLNTPNKNFLLVIFFHLKLFVWLSDNCRFNLKDCVKQTHSLPRLSSLFCVGKLHLHSFCCKTHLATGDDCSGSKNGAGLMQIFHASCWRAELRTCHL